MAKVKIQGHASGTGILTVTAPNTSTDRTITLPDSTDTLAVNSDVTNKLPLAGGTMTGNISHASTLTLDAGSNVHIDADGSNVVFLDGGTHMGTLKMASSNINLDSQVVDKDIIFSGNDGGVAVTALTLDMSDGGKAIFNNGLAIGGTGTANTLDDYEEGTWTPTGTGFTISNVFSATYTKIGRQVTVVSYVTGASGGSNNAAIAGLPFTNRSNGYSVGAVNVTAANPVRTNLLLRAETNSTSMTFYKDNDVAIPGTDVDSGHIIFTLTYFTDA